MKFGKKNAATATEAIDEIDAPEAEPEVVRPIVRQVEAELVQEPQPRLDHPSDVAMQGVEGAGVPVPKATLTPVADTSALAQPWQPSDALVPLSLQPAGLQGFKSVMVENLAGQLLKFNDLLRVKLPAGGGRAWEIPNPVGEADIEKTFTGVILHFQPARAMWKLAFDAPNRTAADALPTCRSGDGVVGVGDPGGVCANCQFNQFGTADKGKGKKCRETVVLFIMRGESVLPLLLLVPPTSLQAFRKFTVGLGSIGKPFYSVVTEFRLGSGQSEGGINYSTLECKAVRNLNRQETDLMRTWRQSLAEAVGGFEYMLTQSPAAQENLRVIAADAAEHLTDQPVKASEVV